MKLAEALLLRSDMNKKFESLSERIGQNAIIQEGDEPHEDSSKLIDDAFIVLHDLKALVIKINKANLHYHLPNGPSIMEAIADRDALVAQHSLLRKTITNAQHQPDRYSMREVKWKTTLKVSNLQKQLEELAKSIRIMNAAIQETNWKSELEF